MWVEVVEEQSGNSRGDYGQNRELLFFSKLNPLSYFSYFISHTWDFGFKRLSSQLIQQRFTDYYLVLTIGPIKIYKA